MASPSRKYDSFRDSALHFLCNADWGNESDGNANAYGVYFTRISLDWNDVWPENTEFESLIEQWDEVTSGAVIINETFLMTLVGHWLVSEDGQGFVHVRGFDTEEQVKARFDAFAQHYAEWSAAERDEI